MASEECLSQVLQSFIIDHIHSVEQLEVLLLLRSEPHRPWTAIEVSQHLRASPHSAANRLEDLNGQRLIRSDGKACYWYDGKNEHEPVLAELCQAYTRYRIRVIEYIFSAPRSRMKDFANAFRIVKDGEHGS